MTHRQPVPVRVRAGDGSLLDGETGPGRAGTAPRRGLLAERGHPADVPDALDLSGESSSSVATGTPHRLPEDDPGRPARDGRLAGRAARVALVDGDTGDVAAAERRYGARIDGTDPTRLWVLEVNGRSVGGSRTTGSATTPTTRCSPAAPTRSASTTRSAPRRSSAAASGRERCGCTCATSCGGYPDAGEFFAPDHRNAASLRVLDKLGFARGLWFDEPQRDEQVDTVVGCSLEVRRVLGWH